MAAETSRDFTKARDSLAPLHKRWLIGRMVNPPSISLNSFAQKAQQAQAAGGALRLDKQGGLVVKGDSFFGKAALWVKDNLFPKASRAENVAVLSALERTLNQEKGSAIEELPDSLPAEASRLNDSHDVTREIAERVAALEPGLKI